MPKTPATLQELIEDGARRFKRAGLYYGHGTDNALDESFHLASFALKLAPPQLAARADWPLTPARRRRIDEFFEKRIKTGLPAPYLTRRSWFCGLSFHVDQRVLVPRSPIAELIDSGFSPWLMQKPASVLDLCTGSGCIGIATAKVLPKTRVDLVELDAGALTVARLNIRRHRLAARVTAIRSDLFESLARRRYDLILSNPPYVPESEWRDLPREYHHEPRLALTAGRDGMDLVARILNQAADHLNPGGFLICEVGGSVPKFEKRFPRFPAIWPEFERGGDGVFIISREELIRWKKNARVR